MTAPDPLECLNSRAAAERTTCGEPDSAHCEKCQSCPNACSCNTAWRYTFTITPLTDTEAQHVINDIRARFGRKPLIHVIGRQPSNTPLHEAPEPNDDGRPATSSAKETS
jgi:hypothetical protein